MKEKVSVIILIIVVLLSSVTFADVGTLDISFYTEEELSALVTMKEVIEIVNIAKEEIKLSEQNKILNIISKLDSNMLVVKD